MDKQPLFSMVIISKNEENTLPKLLDTLIDFRDRGGEIVVLDTGSSDETISIAKKFGCNVFTDDGREDTKKITNTWHYTLNSLHITKNDLFSIFDKSEIKQRKNVFDFDHVLFDYGTARESAVKCSNSNFVFCPDCDEYWKTLNIDSLNQIIERGAYQIKIPLVYTSLNGDVMCKTAREKYFDKRYFEWKWRIHECPSLKKNVNKKDENNISSTVQSRIVTTKNSINSSINKTVSIDEDVASLYHTQHAADNRRWYLQQMCCLYLEVQKNSQSRFPINPKLQKVEPDDCKWGELSSQHHFWFARELKLNSFNKSALIHLKTVYKRSDIWNIEAAAAAMYIGDIYNSLDHHTKAKIWWWKGYYKAPGTRESIGRILRFAHDHDDKVMSRGILRIIEPIKGVESYIKENVWYPFGENPAAYIPIVGYWAFYYGDKEDKIRGKRYWDSARTISPNNEKIEQDSVFFTTK